MIVFEARISRSKSIFESQYGIAPEAEPRAGQVMFLCMICMIYPDVFFFPDTLILFSILAFDTFLLDIFNYRIFYI